MRIDGVRSTTTVPTATTDGAGVPSPCTNVCKIDDTTGWCKGCWRTLDEIAAWAALDDDARRTVLARLPARRSAAPVPRANDSEEQR